MFKEKLEEYNQNKVHKDERKPKRVYGTIKRTASEILGKKPKEEEDFSYLWTPTGDVQDMWDALYKEDKEYEEFLAKRKKMLLVKYCIFDNMY